MPAACHADGVLHHTPLSRLQRSTERARFDFSMCAGCRSAVDAFIEKGEERKKALSNLSEGAAAVSLE